MRIYCTRTQEDYNYLMVDLEKQGFIWDSGHNPTHFKYWSEDKEDTCVAISGKKITFGSIEWYIEEYPDISIIEYRADKQGETDNFIKELTVKIYYNEITKKHYNSYEDAIADCKKEIDKLYDKN